MAAPFVLVSLGLLIRLAGLAFLVFLVILVLLDY